MRTTADSLAEPLLDIAELAEHLRIDNLAVEGNYLDDLIAAATDYVESATGRTFTRTKVEHVIGGFPSGREILLPLPPALAVTSIKYTAPDGTTVTLDPSNYSLDSVSLPGRVILRASSWPATAARPDAVTVNFVAGPESFTDVPPAIIQAVKMIAAHMYENREAVSGATTNEVPLAASSIIALHRYIGAV